MNRYAAELLAIQPDAINYREKLDQVERHLSAENGFHKLFMDTLLSIYDFDDCRIAHAKQGNDSMFVVEDERGLNQFGIVNGNICHNRPR
jgi:hypothetical protein